jgi:hypothetical protein
MRQFHRIAGGAIVLAALLASAPAALALPPIDDDGPILHCPAGYVLVDDVCVKIPPPPPPANSPVVTLETPRQTTDLTAVRVAGRATDADQKATALTVRISIDGVLKRTLVANLPDPPVATPGFAKIQPPVLPGHGFNVTIPAAAGANQVCVTAVNVGSGSDRTLCKQIDKVVEFAGNSISYDMANAQLTGATAETLDKVTNTNLTNVQQSTTISGDKTVTESYAWKHTQGIKATLKTKVGIPFIGESEITIEGSLSFEQSGTSTTAHKFAWSQPVIVPAKSRVVATVAITKTTLNVPYMLSGNFVYASGALVPGTSGGLFTGVNGHDLNVMLAQFNLDGTPAAKPVEQPPVSLLAG